MNIIDLAKKVCPFQRLRDINVFIIGFVYGVKWFFTHEKKRHLKDIEAIDVDLLRLDAYKVDVSESDEFIDM